MTGHEHQHGHQHHFGSDFVARQRLDARLFAGMYAELADWVVAEAGPVRRLLDLGAGIGTGTFALLDRLPGASAVALDGSPELLEVLAVDAAGRSVTTDVVDLDGAWPDLEPVDLVWMADALHHMSDPGAVLTKIADALADGGCAAIAEMSGSPRFLGDSPLEDRIHALLDADRLEHAPAFASDWPDLLGAGGLTVVAERTFAAGLVDDNDIVASARDSLSRTRDRVADRLSPDDVAELDALLAPGGLEAADLGVRFERTVLLARAS